MRVRRSNIGEVRGRMREVAVGADRGVRFIQVVIVAAKLSCKRVESRQGRSV